jgi:hypothetical protein
MGSPPMITSAIVDHDACLVYYLAFDLLLAEAPIRDGVVQLDESHLATAGDDDPKTSARHAVVRAALLKSHGAGFAADSESEIARAESLAQVVGLIQPPAIPDDEVQTLVLSRDGPTILG